MLNVKNYGCAEFRKYIRDKKIYVWGAGAALEACLYLYFYNKNIQCIIDRNSKLWGNRILHNNQFVTVVGKEKFIQTILDGGIQNSILMITSPYYGPEIIEDLDKIPELDGLECFLQVLIRNKKESIPEYSFTNGKQRIPKYIHYIWVGDKPIPEKFEGNINTWKRYNPEYEIICWNERNYDFKKCVYMKEAYESGYFGFVVNYARLDIINSYGGIYLDTDVECVANFDKLLNDKAFFNMGCADRINMGCGFGAESDSKIIQDMMKVFSESHFLNDNGKPARQSCSSFINPVLRKYGFKFENIYQRIDDVVMYPCEVMSPKTIDGMPDFYSKKTVSIHQESGTWQNDAEWEGLRNLKKFIKERLVIDD